MILDTRYGILDVIRKIGKQDIELSDLLTKQLADGRLKYDYGAVQRVAEDRLKRKTLAREAAGKIPLQENYKDTNERQSRPRGKNTWRGRGQSRGRGTWNPQDNFNTGFREHSISRNRSPSPGFRG